MNPYSCKPCIHDLYPSMQARRLWQPSPNDQRLNFWSSGLFDCALHYPSLAEGLLCPCFLVSRSAHFLDQNGFLVPLCASLGGCFTADVR